MNIELYDPNDISLGVIRIMRTGPSTSKTRSYDETHKIVGELFCKLYKEWDGHTNLIGDLTTNLFDNYGITTSIQPIDYEIYACK